ncbi:MAG: ABC transporter permease [Oscillospiraceae bacterium]|nr:ABC transporter permease [Oscillospiraceae bacterium]
MKEYIRFLKKSTLDIFRNIHRIISLAGFEYELSGKDMFLGKLWKAISPLIQIGAYWLVFGIGIRHGNPIDGYPYVVWLTCGVTPWLLMSRSINIGANSVFRKATMLTRANISTVLIPISSILAVIFDNCWTIALMAVIYFANGCTFSWQMINLLYYIFFAFCFLSALSEFTSVLVMLARDFKKLIEMVMRLLFFLSPIMWRPGDNMPQAYKVFDRLNPIAYVIRGFRNSMLYRTSFYEDLKSAAVFWGMTVLLYLIGIAFQKKLKNNILDCM